MEVYKVQVGNKLELCVLFVAECEGGDGEFGCEVASGGLLPFSCHIPKVFVRLLGFPDSRITFFGLGCRLWQWSGCCGGMCSCLVVLFLFVSYIGKVSCRQWEMIELVELDIGRITN